MADAKAKTINLLLYDGDLSGVISIEDSSWNSGELYCAPREFVADLFETDACKKYGVYLLISKDMVYVGQSSDLAKRITQHIAGKEWWERAVILTTKDDSLTRTDIDLLESVLIDKARKIGKLDCDNKNKGNDPKVDRFREVYLRQYLDEALFLMQLIGITVFTESKVEARTLLIDSIDIKTKLAIGKRAKNEAISYLSDHGVAVDKTATYSVLSDDGSYFWANPQKSLLEKEWDLILNNTIKKELIVMRISAYTLKLASDVNGGLFVRADKTDLIDLKLDSGSFEDRRSGVNFESFIVNRVSYS